MMQHCVRIKYIILCVILLSSLSTCIIKGVVEKTVWLIPEDRDGPYVVVYEGSQGEIPKTEEGWHLYDFKDSNVLKMPSDGDYFFRDQLVYSVDSKGNKKLIEILPLRILTGAAVDSTKRYCYYFGKVNPSRGSINGVKTYKHRSLECIVGKISQSSQHHKELRELSKSLIIRTN